MPNQLLQNLQNLLNKKSKIINLISSEVDSIEVSEEQNQKFENIFLILSVVLTVLLSLLTLNNYQKNLLLNERNSQLIDLIMKSKEVDISNEEINSRINKLELYKKINSNKVRVANFFEYISKLTGYLKSENIISIKYSQTGKSFKYEIIVNSERTSLEQDLNTFLKTNFIEQIIKKESEIKVNNSGINQYKFTGNYEVR